MATNDKDFEKPTAQQAAWVIRMFMENADCSFSRKVEIMYPEDSGALHALCMAGGQKLSNALYIKDEDDLKGRR